MSFNILGYLWQLARTAREEISSIEASKLTLRSIIEGRRYNKTSEDSRVFSEALSLYRIGHHKIDNILYAMSLHNGLRFLTLDDISKDLENALLQVDQIPSSEQFDETKEQETGNIRRL
ncbi:hypothetical protein AUF78_18215 [archaeon 13_1_20CM_2_51_12]|nr:MAG: hypothetical protein AUF78_18215 [archaeon 13_1_20CM_2_51_12]